MMPDSGGDASVFPAGFLWGAATSAYQIEGSPLADGAGPSIWHRFAHTPGAIRGGDTGDVACDHYGRWPEDLALMREVGLNAYRFSIGWGRVLPSGAGSVNRKGLDFYDRLVDGLLDRGIAPMATLYHWDLPEALEDRGGWTNGDVASWFADYTSAVVRVLDDRVPLWVTINEPSSIMDGGYVRGTLAPGLRALEKAAQVARNLLLAHAAAVEAYRALGRHRIGIAVALEPKEPASSRLEDIGAAARAEVYAHGQFLDPLFLGRCPEELPEIFAEAWPGPAAPHDLARIRAPIDFLGINYYTRSLTRYDAAVLPHRAGTSRARGAEYTEMGWEVRPEGLVDAVARLRERYGEVPLYVTENGAAFHDPDTVEEGYEDPLRVAYLRDHLGAVRRSRAAGADIRGYFVWSLMDNFEWAEGLSKRFGIVHVDYRTQRRTLKESARFYRRVIATRGGAIDS